jgi:hypothetical protein
VFVFIQIYVVKARATNRTDLDEEMRSTTLCRAAPSPNDSGAVEEQPPRLSFGRNTLSS